MTYEDLVLYRHFVRNVCYYQKYNCKHSKHNLIMQAVGGNWSCLASRMFLTAFNF